MLPPKRFFAAFAAGIGIGALLERRRRARTTTAELPESQNDSLAEELRAKLAESRAGEADAAVEPAAEPAPAEDDLDARRREIHERTRASIDELGTS